MNETYKKQVALLLDVLPYIAQEPDLAIHGGTAINLFIRDMPRLSVDVDLTFVRVDDRKTSLKNIADILVRIKERMMSGIAGVAVEAKTHIGKLLISRGNILVKLEVNLVGRGTYAEPQKVILCERAQEQFDAFVEINMVPFGQLYGGKICAALDRQHPRDLFDVKCLLDNEGFSNEVKGGFIYCLLGSERPIYEMLNPHRLDQRDALSNQFGGMTEETFTYADYEDTRERVIRLVLNSLTQTDREFMIGFKRLKPDWSIYPYERYPSVQWKLLNLHKLKDGNPRKHEEQLIRLTDFLQT